MFEEYTFENILSSMLEKAPSDIDKREGSVIYDALAPAAAELSQYYIELESVMKEAFADTSSREYLILRCAERGIKPYEATAAELKGVFDTEIDLGERFTANGVNFYVKEDLENLTYRLVCESRGTVGNIADEVLTPLKTVNGLTLAKIDGILVPGRDEEETEELRKRYFLSFENMAFGGNRADYINKVKELDGVGDLKVIRAWNGGGTVKLIILGADMGIPTTEVIENIQEAVDPVNGEGEGFAPIDHAVTVVAVGGKTVNITADITYAEGADYESCKSLINDAVDGYFKELAKKWSESENLVVRISYIESRLLDIEGILDVENTKINGEAKNLTIDGKYIPVRGSVNG